MEGSFPSVWTDQQIFPQIMHHLGMVWFRIIAGYVEFFSLI